MSPRADSRTRILEAAAQLFRRQGYEATGLKEIVDAGLAPVGSIYHFFPGGKEQLGQEALRRSGERYLHLIDLVFERAESPAAAVRQFFQLSVDALQGSGFADGCPIASVAVEVASSREDLRLACAEVFASWFRRVADGFDPLSPDVAHKAAIFTLAAFEGAIILSRALADADPLLVTADLVVDELHRLGLP
jgi:TetR/AcrR family transcriptional repressor of lmrAB and yxaGH operons